MTEGFVFEGREVGRVPGWGRGAALGSYLPVWGFPVSWDPGINQRPLQPLENPQVDRSTLPPTILTIIKFQSEPEENVVASVIAQRYGPIKREYG